jgi:hypothetical protein
MIDPPRPPADAKDWTWVIQNPCPECGFDPSEIIPEQLADHLRRTATRWDEVLARPGTRVRPTENVRSPLEYAAHTRDVYRIFTDRARLMLVESRPDFANWDQNATAVEERYWEADPADVAMDIRDNSARAAAVFASVSADQLERVRPSSKGSICTVRTLGVYLLHDLVTIFMMSAAELGTRGSAGQAGLAQGAHPRHRMVCVGGIVPHRPRGRGR